MCNSAREPRDAGPIRCPIANDDPRAVITEGHKFYGLDNRSRQTVGGRHPHAGREVGEGTPVDELAEGHDRPGPVAAMRSRTRPQAALCVSLLLVWVLVELPAGPALSLDWIDDILPSYRWWHWHIERGLEVGIGRANVRAALLPHRAQHRIEIVHAAPGFAERLVHLDMRGQVEGQRKMLLTGRREERVCLRSVTVADRVLQQPMCQDDVRSREVLTSVVALDHIAAVCVMNFSPSEPMAAQATQRQVVARVMSSTRLEKSK